MTSGPAVELAVVIPVLNEAEALLRLLPQLRGQTGLRLEIVVSDGGSQDDSVARAEALGARVVRGSAGRGRQLNRGAAATNAPYLLFLHADSVLPDMRFLRAALDCLCADPRLPRTAGHFGLHFERRDARHALAFRHLEEKSRCGRPQTINGDQGLLIARSWFEELGGYDESMTFFEDQLIAARIFAEGHWLLLPGTLGTSGRRFETEGFHRRYILMALIMGLYWADVRAFFPRARGVYQQQSQTRRLRMWPFFAAIWAMQRYDLGWRGSLAAWLRVGRYVRVHAWQVFFWIDVVRRPRLGPGRYPATDFHDRRIAPLIDNRLADGLTAVLVFVWVMLCLGPCFWLREHFEA